MQFIIKGKAKEFSLSYHFNGFSITVQGRGGESLGGKMYAYHFWFIKLFCCPLTDLIYTLL